jgi:hypothetical protein
MAVEIDRTFALAHALIAWTNSLAAQCAWQDRATSCQRATELAWAALALDDTLPDVHVLLGPIHLPQGETSGGR